MRLHSGNGMNSFTNDDLSAGHLALVVGHPDRTGGMETFCRFLVRSALAAQWRVTVALSGVDIYNGDASTAGPLLTVNHVDWINATCAGDREYDWRRILKRRAWFRHTRPDVAVFVQSSNTPFRASVLGARLAGVPVISTQRTVAWAIDDVPRRRHFLGLVPGLGLHGKRMRLRGWLTAAAAARVVYNSKAVREGYETMYSYSRGKGVVIPNAVVVSGSPETKTSARGNTHTGDGKSTFTIGFVGRIGADKRLDVLLRAAAALELSQPVRLLIHGQSQANEQASLQQLAGELSIADCIEWAGVTADPAAAYARCDAVVLCSPRESSSNMVLEAMAAGKAVIVPRTGGMPELVMQGQCGVCVPPLDVPALTEAIRQLAVNDALRVELGWRARAKAMREHDSRIVAAMWMHLLAQVARRPSGVSTTGWTPPLCTTQPGCAG